MKKINEKEFIKNIKKIMEKYVNSRRMEIDFKKTSDELFDYVASTLYPEEIL